MTVLLRILNVLIACLLTVLQSYGQCNRTETITICDITAIDFDTDGNPDGIINLYDEYFNITGENLERGIWNTRSELMFTLTPETGDVLIWDLRESVTDSDLNKYEFTLFNSNCGNEAAVTINVILGAFSGVALPSFGINDVNLEVCDFEGIDLFSALVSDSTTPSPHLNGVWTYEGGDLPTVEIIGGSFPQIEIPYQPGAPLIDEGVFEFKYTVANNNNCGLLQETVIKLSVVRQVNAGLRNSDGVRIISICENDLIAGNFDNDIDLRDDDYLAGEDIEGFWIQNANTGGEITDRDDSIINLRRLYENTIASENRFDVVRFTFQYTVQKRSGVCSDDSAFLVFNLYEALRPFTQNTNNNLLCSNFSSPTTFNLFSLIEFTEENDVTYDYFNGNWSFISGPEPIPEESLRSLNMANDGILNLKVEEPNNTQRFLNPGKYRLGYNVTNNSVVNPCPEQSTIVEIEILSPLYAGENVSSIELCEVDGQVDLNSLLIGNPANGEITTGGIWADSEGNPTNNIFTFPELSNNQTFDFTYTVSHNDGRCEEVSNLNFTIINTVEIPLVEKATKVCSDNLNIILFEQLDGTPETTGIWTGPNNYQSNNHLGEFIFNNQNLPRLEEGIYTYTVPGTNICNPVSVTELTIEFVNPVENLGEDIGVIFCKVETPNIDLLTLLSAETISTGVFTDLDSSGALTNNNVDFSLLPAGIYNFKYSLSDLAPCDIPSLNIQIHLLDIDTVDLAGEDATLTLCSDNLNIRLFDVLEGNPSTNGIWTGPRGYVSADHIGEFVFNNLNLPRLEAGEYTYTTGSMRPCGNEDTATVTIELIDPVDSIGSDIVITFCKDELNVDLLTVLPTGTVQNGEFTELDITGNLTGSIFNFENLDAGSYNFEYSLPNLAPCNIPSLNIQVRIQDEIAVDNAGVSSQITVCSADLNIILFEQLGGNPDTTGTWSGPENYRSIDHLGEFIFNDQTLPRLLEGIYTYTIEMPNACSENIEATVEIILEEPIAEFGPQIESTFCKTDGDINLTDLLPTNIPQNGIFTDLSNTNALSGTILDVATLVTETYNFQYTLSTTSACESPILDLEVSIIDTLNSETAGISNSIKVCSNDIDLNLFNQLEGNPSTSGTWSGPFGYSTTTNAAIFNNTNTNIARLENGIYTYSIINSVCSNSNSTSTIEVEIIEPTTLTEILRFTRCKSDSSVNLFSLLDNNTPTEGIFTDTQNTESLSEDGRVNFEMLAAGTYNFRYTLNNQTPCEPSILDIELQIIALETPITPTTGFCILDAMRLNDIEVSVLNYNWYTSPNSEDPIIDNPILVDNTTLYLTNIDSENCESDRVEVPIRILNVGEEFEVLNSDGISIRVDCPLDFQDGVTPNNDNQNDHFELTKENLYNIPEAFPDFNLEIYNRFGTIVFKGNKNTEEFRGENNVNLSLGDDLPSGVYFYVFNPNFKNNSPIQGSFYLSK